MNAPTVAEQVQRAPARLGRVGVDPPRHPPQAEQVHREERQVEPDEQQAEVPPAEPARSSIRPVHLGNQ